MGILVIPLIFMLGYVVLIVTDYVDNGQFNPDVLFRRIRRYTILMLVVILLTRYIEKNRLTEDVEVWSGEILEVAHTPSSTEWIPPKTVTYKDSDGRTIKREEPGRWIHHEAENEIKTSDNGWERVTHGIDENGNKVKFGDDYPASNEDLEKYYPVGRGTASVHSYENLLQLDTSIYSYEGEIDLDVYELPEYPIERENFRVKRAIGEFGVKNIADRVDEMNRYLNVELGKQVNFVLVNLGSYAEKEEAYALRAKWKNGKKNDYILAMSYDVSTKVVNWVLPISWTESFELNNRLVQDLTGATMEVDNLLGKVLTEIGNSYERKEMSDYAGYIKYKQSMLLGIIQAVIAVIILALMLALSLEHPTKSERDYMRRYGNKTRAGNGGDFGRMGQGGMVQGGNGGDFGRMGQGGMGQGGMGQGGMVQGGNGAGNGGGFGGFGGMVQVDSKCGYDEEEYDEDEYDEDEDEYDEDEDEYDEYDEDDEDEDEYDEDDEDEDDDDGVEYVKYVKYVKYVEYVKYDDEDA